MDLHNRTQCPDTIIKNLLRRSAKAFRRGTGLPLRLDKKKEQHIKWDVDTCGVAVQFTQRRASCIPTGCCWEGEEIKFGGKWWPTDGGAMRIRLPAPKSYTNALYVAEKLWHVLLHEWGHISDYQQRFDKRPFSGLEFSTGFRRPNWENRPEEIRAEEYKNRVIKKDDGGDELLEWALWYEEKIIETKKGIA